MRTLSFCSTFFVALNLWYFSAMATAETVRFDYVATVQTVSGTPFGQTVPRLTEVTGFFQYDSTTADANLLSDQRGDYPHDAGGGFTANFLDLEVSGSSTPTVQVEDIRIIDTLRYFDGPRSVGKEGGVMSFNGVADSDIELLLAISPGVDVWTSDSLPDSFPFAFDPWPAFGYPHTFSLRDDEGTMLMQFQSISEATSVPEPSGLKIFVGLSALLLARRRRHTPK